MKKIILSISILFLTISAWSQSNTFYFNKNIYQSIDLNPARQQTCKFALGLPGLSSIYLNIKDQGITYKDLFIPYTDIVDSFYTNPDELYDKMNTLNYIFVQNKTSLGYLAFWVRDFYITLNASLNIHQNFTYPKSIFTIKDGNYFTDGRMISFSGLSEDLTAYTEYSLGVSKEVIPGLTVGARFKILSGLANFQTKQFVLDWSVSTENSDIYDYNFNTSYNFQTSSPFVFNPSYDSLGRINGMDIDTSAIDTIKNLALLQNYALDYLKSNRGFGIDFGVVYKIIPQVELSLSVIDFGFIKWTKNPLSVQKDSSQFVFSGLDVGKYIENISIATSLTDQNLRDSILNQAITDLTDSVLAKTQPNFIRTSYKTSLNTTFNFGAAFTPNDWFTVGFLYRGYLYNKKLISSYTLSTTFKFWRGWSYMIDYTMFNKSKNNIGMGFSVKLLPFQFYFLMDNLSIPALGLRYALNPEKPYNQGFATNWVKNTKMVNFQLGFNFMLGCRKKVDYGVID